MGTDRPTLSRRGWFAFVVLLGAFLGWGCSKQSSLKMHQSGLLRKWERTVLGKGELTLTTRTPAAAKSPVCLKDKDSISSLREEIQALETQVSGNPIKGVWNHLNLLKLPRSQGIFLSRYVKWVQSQGYDYKNCSDLICILNNIYGSKTGEEGLLIYGWFLRMGSVISTANRVPLLPEGLVSTEVELETTQFENKTYRDYLFSRDELTGFWLLSKTLSPVYQDMGSLLSIHRMPSGTYYVKWPNSCGFSWGGKTVGNIWLLDKCLEMGDDPKRFSTFFYRGVPHELSHRLDSWLGTPQSELSQTDEWKSLSGWTQEEVADPRSGKVTRRWRSDSSKDGFVRDYAASSPAEDWADTAAYFRYAPAWTLEVSPKKAAYLSKKIYGGRTFDEGGIFSFYLDSTRRELSQSLPSVLDECVAGVSPPDSQDSSDVRSLIQPQFGLAVDPAVEDCLRGRIAQVLEAALARLKENEYEACEFFARNTEGFIKQVVEEITPELVALLSKNSSIANQLRAVAKLNDEFKTNFDPREIYLKCYGKEEEETCYSNMVTSLFDSISDENRSAIPTEILLKEKNRILVENSWSIARGVTTKLFKELFAGVESRLQKSADRLWENCKNSPSSDTGELPPTRPFNGGEHYVSSGILACLNHSILADLDAIRTTFSAKLGITISDPQTQIFVTELWLPDYLEVLSQHAQKEAAAEDLIRESIKAKIVSWIIKELKTSSVMIAQKEVCIDLAIKSFDRYLDRFEKEQAIPTHFAAIENLRKGWSESACQELFKSNKKTLPQSSRSR